MPTVSEPEPQQAGMQAAAIELVKLLEADHPEVTSLILSHSLSFSLALALPCSPLLSLALSLSLSLSL
eukprot:COSAG03_NODE_7739_length_878_cov_0.973042_1_plen_67_part_01